nr:hypothetical protein [Chryseobacterium joostei]
MNADGMIVHSNDFSVNESSLTGERFQFLRIVNPRTILCIAVQLQFQVW